MYTSKNHTGSTLIIYRDESDPMFAGWAFRVVSDAGHESGCVDDLIDLYELIKRTRPENLDGLPVFNRRTPEDTHGVWSWDARYVLVGDCPDSLDVVRRDRHGA